MFNLSIVETLKHIHPSGGMGFVLSGDELLRLHMRLVEILADIDRVCRQNGWNRLCRNECSRFITCPSGRKHFFGQMAPREEFATTRDIMFEGHSAKVGSGIVKHMIRLYGEDYMTPPPDTDREQHVFLKPFSV